MWEPRRLTTLWASRACRGDGFSCIGKQGRNREENGANIQNRFHSPVLLYLISSAISKNSLKRFMLNLKNVVSAVLENWLPPPFANIHTEPIGLSDAIIQLRNGQEEE
jgi:hypothetical protein